MQFELLLQALGALGIGLLVGLERENHQRDHQVGEEAAGIRTFAFVALIGNLLTWLPGPAMPWALMLGLAVIASLAFLSYRRSSVCDHIDIGMTTETVLVLTYILGVLTGIGYILQATIIAIIVFTLLSYKKFLHRFSYSLSPMDIRQTIQFLIVTVVILPILPDHGYGPFGALNPQHIWLMVVLICGIGFAAYAAIKLFGHRAGLGLTGLLGGLVSSTAVTMTMSRLAESNPKLQAQCILAILLACLTMFPRVWAFTLIFSPQVAFYLVTPILLIIAVTLTTGWLLWRKSDFSDEAKGYHPELNPLSLRIALGFGVFFALIMLAVHAAQHYFGDAGILGIAALSGLSDVDAITLSLIQMETPLPLAITAQAILLASASNTAVKLGIGLSIAPPSARRWLIAGLLPMMMIAVAAVLVIRA